MALTRLMSAVFRKGGDVAFMVDELKAVFDPRGGYWQPGGKFMPSIIAELGHIVEKHLRFIGLLPPDSMDEHKRKLVEQKRREFEDQKRQQDAFARTEYPTGRPDLRRVQCRCRGLPGRLHDLPGLRRLQVRLGEMRHRVLAMQS